MGNCHICQKDSKHYVLCKDCLKKLKEEATKETKIEFELQYNLPTEEQSQIFSHVSWEYYHNNFYEKVNEEEYKKELYKMFEKIYKDKLIGCKLRTIKTGKKINPNDIEYWL